ncbi:IS66 family transposase, partial [Eubacterium sp. AF22-8LB]
HWLKPLTGRMHEILLESKHAHADETPVQVLNEPGKKATTKSYMWVYSSIKESSYPIRLFVYAPNRCGYNP